LKDEPNNYEILYKLSDAYIGIIDIKTAYLMEEKDEYKPILKNLGQKASEYAEKALKLNPKSKEAVASAIRAYAYYSSSFGIMKAMFKGAAGHFKDLCNQLIKLDDKFMGALGYLSMGKFYFMAPWPVGSDSKSLSFFKKALAADNATLYSHYYVGVLSFDDKKWDLAEKEFVFVRDNPPIVYEKHYIEAYKKKADEYLAKIAKKKKR
jgi:tetratricopeptide (TPR) repeat protein